MKFIAALDQSGGSTPSTLERYGIDEWMGDDGMMRRVHDMRLRIINSPSFTNKHISTAIMFKDTISRGAVDALNKKHIESYLKVDSGCEEDGTLKVFNLDKMIQFAIDTGCTGTKMRSIIKTAEIMSVVLEQQFEYAQRIADAGLMPIVEPEIPINHPYKEKLELLLFQELKPYLKAFAGEVILKLTIPDVPNTYVVLSDTYMVKQLVGLSGGYSTEVACEKLSQNANMGASFSRGLTEGLHVQQTEEQFDEKLLQNILMISNASASGLTT